RTPFNIGESILLSDFTRAEVRLLEDGLRSTCEDPGKLLDEVYAWTSGHPYMTQRICEKLVAQGRSMVPDAVRVAKLVDELFLERGQSSDQNLNYAAERLANRARSTEMLDLYRRVRQGEGMPTRGKGSIEEELWLTGMVAERRNADGSCLYVR